MIRRDIFIIDFSSYSGSNAVSFNYGVCACGYAAECRRAVEGKSHSRADAIKGISYVVESERVGGRQAAKLIQVVARVGERS